MLQTQVIEAAATSIRTLNEIRTIIGASSPKRLLKRVSEMLDWDLGLWRILRQDLSLHDGTSVLQSSNDGGTTLSRLDGEPVPTIGFDLLD